MRSGSWSSRPSNCRPGSGAPFCSRLRPIRSSSGRRWRSSKEARASRPRRHPFQLAPEERFVPQAGMKIGRYRVGTLLGSGGAGSVYAAFDEELNRPVAIKFVSSRRSGSSDAPALPLREARAASALDHPNIIMIHEVIETQRDGRDCDGAGERRHAPGRCRKGPPFDEVLRWSTQLAHALAVAHDHGLIHGDIKPENVMVRDDGYIKLLDFGLALDAQPRRHAGRNSQERCVIWRPSGAWDSRPRRQATSSRSA